MKNTKIFLYSIFAIILTTFGVWSVFAALNFFKYENPEKSGYELEDGIFYLTNDKSGKVEINNPNKWNAGLVDMRASGLDNEKLMGEIILQSIGKDNLSLSDIKIVPPSGVNVTRTCWKLSSAINTRNAGKITLDNVRYNPVSGLLEGYGYNRNLGNVWFGMDTYCADEKINDAEVEEIEKPEIRSAFIGRVKIIGNIGANNTIFDKIYTQEKWVEHVQFSRALNQIRENIFIRSRNISDNLKNKDFNTQNIFGDTIFYFNENSDLQTLQLDFIPDNIHSIVVVGGDIVIGENISETSHPRVIIAIQNEKNLGGSIYIKKNVQKINASLVAEKAILSGEGEWPGENALYNDDSKEVAKIPYNQLYIKGFIASRNTIGGASNNLLDVKCPYLPAGSIVCDQTTAQIFDLNYFRNFDKKNGDTTRAYVNDTLDPYSVIIEYDKNIIANPPVFLQISK